MEEIHGMIKLTQGQITIWGDDGSEEAWDESIDCTDFESARIALDSLEADYKKAGLEIKELTIYATRECYDREERWIPEVKGQEQSNG